MQYHGGTNFGKSASSYVTTSYYDQAPLDEYGQLFLLSYLHVHGLSSKRKLIFHLHTTHAAGLIWLPTWGHLRELHAVIKLCQEALLWGRYTYYSLAKLQEVRLLPSDK